MANYFNEKFNLTINRSTVSKILLTKEKWLTNKQTSNMFRLRSVKYPKLDKAIELWVSQAIAAGLPLSDQILQEKGCDFARSFNIDDYYMRCSNGVYKFKKRYGLHKIILHGEGGSAPLANIEEERPNIQQILSEYDPGIKLEFFHHSFVRWVKLKIWSRYQLDAHIPTEEPLTLLTWSTQKIQKILLKKHHLYN